ncbi:MAG: hypothetical protein R3E79_25920 [Caldilineaceae bacterium]
MASHTDPTRWPTESTMLCRKISTALCHWDQPATSTVERQPPYRTDAAAAPRWITPGPGSTSHRDAQPKAMTSGEDRQAIGWRVRAEVN